MAKKICLIDDEKDCTELLGSILNFNGFEAEMINNPIAGFERCKEASFDAVVVDLMMPGMDGMTLIKGLRGIKAYEDTPIFVLTCKQLNDDERSFLLNQKVHFVAKPFDPRRLVDQIRQAL